MTDATTTRPEAIVDEVITSTLPCFACDYDLRSLRADDRCPECGQPISESIRAAGAWNLRRLRQARIVYAALIISAMAWIVPPILVWIADPNAGARALFAIAVAIQAISTLIAGVVGCLAGSRRRRAARLWLVIGISAVAAAPVIGLVWSMLTSTIVSLVWTSLFLSGALVGRSVLVLTAIGTLRFASTAVGLPGRLRWTVAAWIVGLSALAETGVAVSYGSGMGTFSEGAMMLTDFAGAAGMVMACTVGVPLMRAINARLKRVVDCSASCQ